MRLLLDTHILLWSVGASRKLPVHVQSWLMDEDNDIYFSAASIWEIAIKVALAKPDFQVEPDDVLTVIPETGFLELPITSNHAKSVRTLPAIHKDPFDRILIAQAQSEGIMLLTNDEMLVGYSPLVRLISGV